MSRIGAEPENKNRIRNRTHLEADSMTSLKMLQKWLSNVASVLQELWASAQRSGDSAAVSFDVEAECERDSNRELETACGLESGGDSKANRGHSLSLNLYRRGPLRKRRH